VTVDIRLTDIQKILATNCILTCFSGRFSQGLIEEMGTAIKNHMESEARSKSVIYNVFSVYIEQTQNIKNYTSRKLGSPPDAKITNSAIVCIGTSGESYFIWSGNLIENSDIGLLRDRLELLSKQSKEELRQLYKDQLKKEVSLKGQGAGSGLIDIARKASAPIEYSFYPVDANFSFYEIKVMI
jgi:hypothetical protein